MKNLNQLVEAVKAKLNTNNPGSVLELKSLLQEYNGEDWRDYLSNESKTPKTNVLLRNEQVKIILVYWNGFQKTQKHGHPSGGGISKVLMGTLKETRFDPNDTNRVIGTNHYFKGAISYIHDKDAYHVVENPISYPAASLHVYMPGIYVPTIIPQEKTQIYALN